MDISILEDLGLASGEIKVYLTLMRLGSTKVGQIIDKSGIASSAVHNALKKLREKGLVTHIMRGKIKFYSATPPGHMVEYLDEKREKLVALMPELEAMCQAPGERQEAEIYEGIRGFRALMAKLQEGIGKGDEYLFFAINAPAKNKEIQELFARYDLWRKELGVPVRGLAPKELKYALEWRTNIEVRYPDFPIPANTSICRDKIAFFSWEEGKLVGFLIQSKQIAGRYRDFFRKVWDKARR